MKIRESDLRIKMFNGESALDLMRKCEFTEVELFALLREIIITDEAYRRSGLANSKAPKTDDWRSYISIPGDGS